MTALFRSLATIEEAFDAAVDLVRQLRFPFWSSFRPFDSSLYLDYLHYMTSHGIPFEKEIHGDHSTGNWFLVDSDTDHSTWGIEPRYGIEPTQQP